MEEVLRQKYRYLRYDIVKIKEQLQELYEDYNQMNSAMKKCIMIDDHFIEGELFTSLKEDNKKILEELEHIVLPKINSKSG